MVEFRSQTNDSVSALKMMNFRLTLCEYTNGIHSRAYAKYE